MSLAENDSRLDSKVLIASPSPHLQEHSRRIVSHLPGGHFPPPKFGHLPPPNSDISHPPKKNICQEDNCHPQFFSSFFWCTFLGFFDLQLMGRQDGKEGVVDKVTKMAAEL